MKLKIKYNWLRSGLYLFFLLLLPLLSFGDNAANALFTKANKEYDGGYYQQAIKSYQRVLDGGYQSATIYFDLGNTYYKLDDIPSALLYYEKAHKINPTDEDINFNIRLARSKTTDKLDQVPEFFVTAWWHSFILLLSANTFAITGILLFLAGFGVFILYIFTNSARVKKVSFFGGITLLCLGLIGIFLANRQANYFSNHHQAIVFSSSVTAKSSPDVSGRPLFVVHEGTKVDVMKTIDTWIEVELPNGNAGWIAAADVKEI